jgi:hypothetical protein
VLVETLKLARGTKPLRGPQFEYARLISKVLLDTRTEETVKAVGEGRSSKKSDEVKEVGGVMCKMISPHEARELPAPQCYRLTSPHLYTSNNHASVLLHVFLSSYIIEHRC